MATVMAHSLSYDALLLLSFGGPEGPDDVMPFLRNVTRGRHVPDSRLMAVSHHYAEFGGVSPINAQNRALKAAIEADFTGHDIALPVYWGNRNWSPYVEDVVAQMAADGVRRALVFVTSAYASYSACRQYLEDLDRAREAVGPGAPELHKLRHYFDHPGFIEPQRDAVRAALADIPEPRHATTRLIFVAHSIPESMAESAGPEGGLYVAQLRAAAELIASAADGFGWDLAYSSRSGPPKIPWLGPDVGDLLVDLATSDGTRQTTDVIVVPVGFISDHIEVRWDLDVEAKETADGLDIRFHRTEPPASDPRFVAMVRELVQEQVDTAARKRALSPLGPSHDICPKGCCLQRDVRG
jgi:ferrochelatase